jgi:hypothetical protein
MVMDDRHVVMIVSFDLAVLISVYTPPWWWIMMLFCFCCIPKRLAGDRLGKGEVIKSGMLDPWKRSFGILCLLTFLHAFLVLRYMPAHPISGPDRERKKRSLVGYTILWKAAQPMKQSMLYE